MFYTWNKLAQTITTITTPHKLQTQWSNYENLFCSFDVGWSASTSSQGEQSRSLAGKNSQLEEAAVRQMTRRGDHIERQYKFMAVGKPKSNCFCLYLWYRSHFSEQCEHTKKFQSFQSNLGSFDMWSLIWLCVQSEAMWPEHTPSDGNWMVSSTPFFFCYVHIRSACDILFW